MIDKIFLTTESSRELFKVLKSMKKDVEEYDEGKMDGEHFVSTIEDKVDAMLEKYTNTRE